jgi:hypothetical protein
VGIGVKVGNSLKDESPLEAAGEAFEFAVAGCGAAAAAESLGCKSALGWADAGAEVGTGASPALASELAAVLAASPLVVEGFLSSA